MGQNESNMERAGHSGWDQGFLAQSQAPIKCFNIAIPNMKRIVFGPKLRLRGICPGGPRQKTTPGPRQAPDVVVSYFDEQADRLTLRHRRQQREVQGCNIGTPEEILGLACIVHMGELDCLIAGVIPHTAGIVEKRLVPSQVSVLDHR